MDHWRTRACLWLAALVLSASPSLAQDLDKLKNSTPEQRATLQTEYLKKNLPLSADQVPKVKEIELAAAQKSDPIIKGSGGPLIRLRQLGAIQDAKDASLRQVLSAEQYTKYLDLKDKAREDLEAKVSGG